MKLLYSRLGVRGLNALLAGQMDDLALMLPGGLSDLAGVNWHEWTEVYNLLSSYSLDYIIPVSRGGKDHPKNYFLMPTHVNFYFGNSWSAEKVLIHRR